MTHKPTTKSLEALSDALLPSLYEAGQAIMAIHANKVSSRLKPDGSPVTQADELAEEILLAALAEHAPDIAVISEENTASHHLAPPELFFLVDPIDGTKEFLKPDGQGSFTVNIGLIYQGAPVMGLVYAPAFDALYCGIVGKGAEKITKGERNAISVRDVPEDGAVAVASASHRDKATNDWLERHQITKTISVGSSLKLCLVAEGVADVYPRFGPTMEWDTAAGDGVLRAAGGMVTTDENAPYPYGKADYRNQPFIAWGKWLARE